MNMNCGIHDNTTIGPDEYHAQYWQLSVSISKNVTYSERTYLRPDTAGSIIPWPYALACIGWSVEAYLSTQRRPGEILVWSPLTIILDVGAVMQLVFLVVEDFAEKGFGRQKAEGLVAFRVLMSSFYKPRGRSRPASVKSGTEPNTQHIELVETGTSTLTTPTLQPSRGKALIVILAVLLFFALLSLQIIGLASAVVGLRVKDTLDSTWCSPMFESFAIGVLDGNCRLHAVSPSASHGIGCITLSGARQAGRLAASLALELADLLILALVESATRWRGAKMRRPWCTIRLPSGVPEVVWVFRKEPSLGIETVCRGVVTPAGVRGSIMGWTDGFLSNWGSTYFG
ncbi:hypothetical protein LQW54_009617 [Pestalotiopsis sp. IQ-011]